MPRGGKWSIFFIGVATGDLQLMTSQVGEVRDYFILYGCCFNVEPKHPQSPRVIVGQIKGARCRVSSNWQHVSVCVAPPARATYCRHHKAMASATPADSTRQPGCSPRHQVAQVKVAATQPPSCKYFMLEIQILFE